MHVADPKPALRSAGGLGLIPKMLNHYARITHDVAATADFYTRILGMEIASTILDDRIPSTGDAFPYFHIFFRMGDGSTIAFFECADMPPRAKASHPAYDVLDHLALQVNEPGEIPHWKKWLASNGVDVLGPIDHKGIIESIYFHDPNGYRLELTTPVDPLWNRHTKQGEEDLQLWVETKNKARERGEDVGEALVRLIRDIRKNRYGERKP